MARTGLFISHVHEDQELAEPILGLLETAPAAAAAGITCTSDVDYGLKRADELASRLRERLK
jgi:hypothetical protein